MESLLKEILLDHVKAPKNRGEISDATYSANSNNPVCGDVVKIDIKIENGIVSKIGTSGQGCAISQASMSIFSQEIDGISVEEIQKKVLTFKSLFDGSVDSADNLSEQAQLLKFLENNPSKIRCAMLSWSALNDVINEQGIN